MVSLEQLTIFFGWCSFINILMLLLITCSLAVFGGKIIAIHSRMFDISEQDLKLTYFRYIAQYKVASLVFFIVPYLTLKIMS